MAGRLEDKDMDKLETWIGTGPKTFTLLYSITRDGCNGSAFHQKCDNQGATVTVLYNQQNSIYGGYAAQSWNSGDGYTQDALSFLYQLNYNGSFVGKKFPCKNTTYSMYRTPDSGPTFGYGHDLYTFNGTVNNSGGYFALNGYMNIGHSFDNQGIQVQQINNGNMNVTELEVYGVANGERKRLLKMPWRKTPSWDGEFLEKLTTDVVKFKPPSELEIHQVRILMIGPVGAGKSSFFNTIDSIFRNRISRRAGSGSADHSLTKTFKHYEVRNRTGTSGDKLNIRICDTMGIEESGGLDTVEFNYLLDGNIPESYTFNPTSPITPRFPGFISDPSVGDRIHCVALVLDATTLEVLPDKVLENIKTFQGSMNQRGIPQLILLTKIDKICKTVETDVSDVYRSKNVKEHAEKVSQVLGIQLNSVLPVKNYEAETDLEENISILALLALRQLLNSAEDFMENLLDS